MRAGKAGRRGGSRTGSGGQDVSLVPSGVGLGLAPGPEFDLIRSFYRAGAGAGVSRADVRVGPGDDCTVVVGNGIALSSDMSVEGVHFRRDWLTEREIGYRAAAAALSDLAAVAARPIGVLASLALPDDFTGAAATALMEGVAAAAEAVGGSVLGGDVTRTSGPLVVDVTVVGEARSPVLRAGARPGDEVWVTGELGGAAAALVRLLAGERPDDAARRRFAAPSPRIEEAGWLAEREVPHAMIDLSDGLAGDLDHIATASRVRVILDAAAVPVHPSAARVTADPEAAFRLAVSGGEDYELCFTAAAGRFAPLASEFHRRFGVRATRVGSVSNGAGVFAERQSTGLQPLALQGYQHFRGGR